MINQKPILFDLIATQPNRTGKRHGGGKYGEIILNKIIENNIPIICYYNSKLWLNPQVLELINRNNIPLIDVNIISIDKIVDKYNIKLIYSALPDSYLVNFTKCHVVGTVHGLRTVETPLDNYFWKYKNETLKSKIKFILQKLIPTIGYMKNKKHYIDLLNNPLFSFVTVSYHSQSAFKSYFPQSLNYNIPVYYSPSTAPKNLIINRKINGRFFLMVSGNRWEKNNLRAIIALDKLFSNGYLEDYYVIITGVSNSSIYNYKIKNANKFKFKGYIDDIELEQLYHDAYCLIYPSLNEGFGYPPLDAMRYGTPVIASPFTSINEICAEAALYTNPFSVEEIMNRVIQITDNNIYTKQKLRSHKRYQFITEKQEKDLNGLVNYIYELNKKYNLNNNR